MQTSTVDATFRDGALVPDRPLHLVPGQRVRVTVHRPANPSRWDSLRLKQTPLDDEAALTAAGLAEWAAVLDEEDAA